MKNESRKREFAKQYKNPNLIIALFEDFTGLELERNKDLGDILFIDIMKYYIKKNKPPFNTIKYTKSIITRYQIWSAENYNTDQLPIIGVEMWDNEMVSLVRDCYRDNVIRDFNDLQNYVNRAYNIQGIVYPIGESSYRIKDYTYISTFLIYEGISLEDIINITWKDVTIMYNGIQIIVNDKKYFIDDSGFVTIVIMDYMLHKSEKGYLVHDNNGEPYENVETLKKKIYFRQDLSLKVIEKSSYMHKVKQFEVEHDLEPITLEKYGYKKGKVMLRRLLNTYSEVTGEERKRYSNSLPDLFFIYLNM